MFLISYFTGRHLRQGRHHIPLDNLTLRISRPDLIWNPAKAGFGDLNRIPLRQFIAPQFSVSSKPALVLTSGQIQGVRGPVIALHLAPLWFCCFRTGHGTPLWSSGSYLEVQKYRNLSHFRCLRFISMHICFLRFLLGAIQYPSLSLLVTAILS